MKKINGRNFLVMFLSLAMVHALAASASIGIATAKGSFRVDDSAVAGNATLFEGATVETGVSTGELSLAKAKVVMATDTRGRVFQDRLILDRGKVQWGGANYRAVAGEFLIVGADTGSKALVERNGERVHVASLSGTVNVFSRTGEFLMAVSAGASYDFEPEPQGASPGKKKDRAGATTISTGAKVLITVGSVVAGGTAAGVLATRSNSTSTSR